MTPEERREASVRALLENAAGPTAAAGGTAAAGAAAAAAAAGAAPARVPGAPPPVPPGLYEEAVRLGRRTLRRRSVLRRTLWVLLCAAVAAFTWWALDARPWVQPPSQTTPTVRSW